MVRLQNKLTMKFLINFFNTVCSPFYKIFYPTPKFDIIEVATPGVVRNSLNSTLENLNLMEISLNEVNSVNSRILIDTKIILNNTDLHYSLSQIYTPSAPLVLDQSLNYFDSFQVYVFYMTVFQIF